jgi:hypothetical protein
VEAEIGDELYGTHGSPMQQKSDAAILLRLPTYPYAPTCQFLTALMERQFPSVCPGDDETFSYTGLSDNGFGGESEKVARGFAYNLAKSATSVYTKARKGNKNVNERGWIWANEKLCPEETYRNDSMACNFLPHSGCFAEVHKEDHVEEWVGFDLAQRIDNDISKHATLNSLKISWETITAYGDGHQLSMTVDKSQSSLTAWASIRAYAFLLRPRMRMRHFIRSGLHHISHLSDSNPIARHGHHLGEHHGDHHHHHVQIPNPCIGMHVRNGDSMHDFRGGRKVDRSMNSHVYHTVNVSKALGIKNVYLATDNGTLPWLAPLEYPDFRWFSQDRMMHPGSSDAKLDELASRGHRWAHESTGDVAGILVDALAMGRCDALVGQGDGCITYLFHVWQCNLASGGACPPFINLESVAKEYAPYIGSRHNASTFATYRAWNEDAV